MRQAGKGLVKPLEVFQEPRAAVDVRRRTGVAQEIVQQNGFHPQPVAMIGAYRG